MVQVVRLKCGDAPSTSRAAISGNRCLNFSDPFGLCDRPGEPACHGFLEIVGQFFKNVKAGSNCALDGKCESNQLTFGHTLGRMLGTAAFVARMGNTGIGSENLDPNDLPGSSDNFTKLRGNQGYRDTQGNIWRKDQLHKDHWDVMDRRGTKIKEVDFEGNQLWPGGPKNKNK
jgi:hypothetical protein